MHSFLMVQQVVHIFINWFVKGYCVLQFNIFSPTWKSSHRTARLDLMHCSCLLVMCPAPWQPTVNLDTPTSCTTMQEVRPHNWIHKYAQFLSYQNSCMILTIIGYKSWLSYYVAVIVSSYKYTKRWQLINDMEKNLFWWVFTVAKKKNCCMHIPWACDLISPTQPQPHLPRCSLLWQMRLWVPRPSGITVPSSAEKMLQNMPV
jgi:hypothetical protein